MFTYDMSNLLVGLATTGFEGLAKIDWPALIGEVTIEVPSNANCLFANAATTGDLNRSPAIGAKKTGIFTFTRNSNFLLFYFSGYHNLQT